MKKILTTASTVLALATTSQAVVIAQYTFENSANRRASNDTELLTTASILNTGITGSFSGDTSRGIPAGVEVHNEHTDSQNAGERTTFDAPVSGFAVAGAFDDIKSGSNSLTGALGANQYLGFTIDLGTAASIDLNSFSFGTDITNGTAAKNWWLLADTVGGTFTSADQIGSGSFTANEGGSLTSFTTSTFSSDTEFRLYFDTGASTGSHGFAIDNITLDADVTPGAPIPEPGAALLGGLGALLLLRRRR